jgi:hypothetical protein
MHYANGRAAKVGDVVRGRGYNIKYEIVGLLLTAQPENSACNCTVACVTHRSQLFTALPHTQAERVRAAKEGWSLNTQVHADLEYGQLDHFVALDVNSGEILPPEETDEAN